MSTTQPQSELGWPWSPLLWSAQWPNLINAAPQWLRESILPWTFAGVVINEKNSRNPALERNIVSTESYGTQLGCISDALASVIDKTGVKPDVAINAFLQLKAHIDAIKNDSEATRFASVLADLRCLREADPKRFSDCLRQVAALAEPASPKAPNGSKSRKSGAVAPASAVASPKP